MNDSEVVQIDASLPSSRKLGLGILAAMAGALGVSPQALDNLSGGRISKRWRDDYSCIECEAEIPPGRAGRKCPKCRGLA